MENARIVRWIIPFKKFGMVRVNKFPLFPSYYRNETFLLPSRLLYSFKQNKDGIYKNMKSTQFNFE